MISLKIISALLEYPDQALWQAVDELNDAVNGAEELNADQRQRLVGAINWCCRRDLLDAQADYCALFDRGRATSMLLFEHVHGESRDRGQAMVDLLQQYHQAGLAIDSRELPDHLPLFLEFLSTLPTSEALGWLDDIAPILALLGARLHQRNSGYAALFDLLAELSGNAARSENLLEKVAVEARDDTVQALDAVWEEEQIRFIATENCADDQLNAHQRRFSGAVIPQYLSIESATRRTGGEE
jgi:nitrate reductase delta subunit